MKQCQTTSKTKMTNIVNSNKTIYLQNTTAYWFVWLLKNEEWKLVYHLFSLQASTLIID